MKKIASILFIFFVPFFSYSLDTAACTTSMSAVSFSRADLQTKNGDCTGGTAILQPQLCLQGNTWTGDLAFRLFFDSQNNPVIEPVALYFEQNILSNWGYKIGIFPYNPGSPLLFSNTAFFAPPLTPATVFNGKELTSQGECLIAIRYNIAWFSCSAFFAPFSPIFQIENLNASLFQYATIQDPFSYNFFGNNTDYNLADILYSYNPSKNLFTWDPSFSVEMGYKNDYLKTTLYLFYGKDRTPAICEQVQFSLYNSIYTLYRDIKSNPVTALGLDVLFAGSSWKTYFNGSIVWNRLFTVDSVYEITPGDWQNTTSKTHVQYTAGISKKYLSDVISIDVEVHNSCYIQSSSTLNPSFLHRAFYTDVAWHSPWQGLCLSGSYLHSLQDSSCLIGTSASFALAENLSGVLAVHVPSGEQESELGQYAHPSKIFVSLTIGYNQPLK